MARNQFYFGPDDPSNQLSTSQYVEVTNAATATIAISVLSGEIEVRGSSGAVPAMGERGFPMSAGDVMLPRALADVWSDPAITRVFVRAIRFQSEILVDTTDA
jgi:hypothetical protein